MVEVITRAAWGARYPNGFTGAPTPASEVWLHHSVTIAPDLVPPFDDEVRAMRTLEDIGQQRFGGGISYTFAAMPSGRIYEGHGVDRQGAHTGGRNNIARAIVLVGNADATPLTAQQVEGVAQLLVHGWRRGYWRAPRLNGGHQQAPGASTACPGRYGMAAIAAINARAAQLASGTPAPSPTRRKAPTMYLIRNAKGTVVHLSPTWAEWVPTAADHKALTAQLGAVQTLSDVLFDALVRRARAAGTPPAAPVAARMTAALEASGADPDDPATWPATPEGDE